MGCAHPRSGRLQQALVVLDQVGVQRQDHERQVGINDADIDRPGWYCRICSGSSRSVPMFHQDRLLSRPLLLRIPIQA